MLEGRTVIAIAHRLFSAHDADRVAVVEDGVIAAKDGRILYAGPTVDAPAFEAAETIDCAGRWITPGLIDPHTHLIFGGDRAADRTGPRDDGHALVGGLDADFDDAFVFLVGQGRAFAGGADGDQALGAFLDLPIDEIGVGFFVDRSVSAHRCDQRDERAFEQHRPSPEWVFVKAGT